MSSRVQEVAELGLFSNLRAMVIGNPVTGDSYLLLDIPKDPPPPMALDFKPDRPYVPMMPSPLVKVRDQLAGPHRASRGHPQDVR